MELQAAQSRTASWAPRGAWQIGSDDIEGDSGPSGSRGKPQGRSGASEGVVLEGIRHKVVQLLSGESDLLSGSRLLRFEPHGVLGLDQGGGVGCAPEQALTIVLGRNMSTHEGSGDEDLKRGAVTIISVALVCLTVLAWGVFIWPTPYRYEEVTRPYFGAGKVGQKEEVYRINRFTGESEKVVDPIPSPR